MEPQFSLMFLPSGWLPKDDDFRAEFAQHAGRGFVGRAVAAIQNNFHAFERQAFRERLDLANSM